MLEIKRTVYGSKAAKFERAIEKLVKKTKKLKIILKKILFHLTT